MTTSIPVVATYAQTQNNKYANNTEKTTQNEDVIAVGYIVYIF